MKHAQKATDPSAESHKAIESLSERLKKKDDECALIRRELAEANSARCTLEADKSKAQVNKRGLLRRVQELENWTSGINDTLETLNIDSSKEPFWETWGKVEALRNYMKRPTRPCSSSQHNDECPTSPSQIVQQTQLTYRTNSIQPGAHSSPRHVDTDQQARTGTNIVPFSDIHRQLSREGVDSQKDNLGALSEFFTFRSDKQDWAQTNGHQDSLGAEPISESTNRSTDQKTPSSRLQDRKTDKTEDNGMPKALHGAHFKGSESQEALLRQVAAHQIRRTYSRNRHEPTAEVSNAPATSLSTARVIPESPHGHTSKRAKISTASDTSKPRQAAQNSNFFEPKLGTPAGQTPGNILPPASTSRQGRTTKGQRRSRRQHRGNYPGARIDKYENTNKGNR